MAPKYNHSESEETSDIAESSDNFHVVPSVEEEPLISIEQDDDESIDLVTASELQGNVEEQQEQTPPHPIVVLLFKLIRFMLLPVCKIVFAPAAQKTIVKTTVMVITLSWIIFTSLFAYILFYNRYVPPITHVQPIWFHYTSTSQSGPFATIDILSGKSVPLRHEQEYDVSVQLHVPTSDVNFDIGNFMIDIQLQTVNGSGITRSSRPAILRYQSRTQRIMRVFAKAIPLLIGFSEESQIITTKLIDSFIEQKQQAVNKVELVISDPKIQIYDAKLMILAKFRGLRYYMYYHRIMTALSFIFMFAIIEFICATFAWKLFGEKAWHKVYEFITMDLPPPEGEQQIIEEKDISESTTSSAPPSISESE